MSDSNFSVNADAMTPAVDGLAQLGDRLSQITQHLESTLDGLGTPWGDDKNGHNFFQQYGKSRDQTLSGMSSMVDAVHGVSKGIHTMIKGYNNINDSAKERARNLQTTGGDGDGSGGGGGNYGDSYSSDQTPLQPERAFMRSRMPAEPLQRGVLREGKLLPEQNNEPPSSWLAREGEPVQPADRGIAPEGFTPAREGEPAEPLLPRKAVMDRLLPVEKDAPAREFVRADAPSTEGTVTQPEFSALEPAVPGEYVRAEAPVTEGRVEPLEPLQPTEHVRMEARRLVEPLQPAHYTSERPAIPAEHVRMEAVRPTEPLQPAHYTSVRPAIPAERPVAFERDSLPVERPVAFERVQDSIPAERPVAFVRDSIPAEPMGFAELEPERYTSRREAEIPEQ